MKLHIEFDIDLNDQWKDLFFQNSFRTMQRIKTALGAKIKFGKISNLRISPKTSEV